MAGYGDNKGHRRNLKATCVTFVLVISICLLFVGIVASWEIKGCTVTSASSSNHKHAMLLGKERHSVPVKLDPIYVSKRRVPSGPDPIHNRHVGESRRPPGRV